MKNFSVLVTCTLLLTLLVIALGAYTRLTDAGLGCPDWPGCYGKLTAPLHEQHVTAAKQQFPYAEIEPHKAHKEMLHRYIAGLLGICVLAIFVSSMRLKKYRLLAAFILVLVIFQAVLGMWTVTFNLLPIVVVAHLFGGFTLLGLLALLRIEIVWNYLKPDAVAAYVEPQLTPLLPLGYIALWVLVMQIALGGWTSSNYAAAVCYQLPFCEAGWSERFSLQAALSLPMGKESYEYGVLPYEARMSIHVLHRIGAIVTLFMLSIFLYLCWRRAATSSVKKLTVIIASLLVLQVVLGLINIIAHLPLLNAVAHNLVAANLFMLMIVFLRQIYLRRVVDGLKTITSVNSVMLKTE